MMNNIKVIKAMLIIAIAILSLNTAMADDELLKPYVLASNAPGTLAAKTETTKAALIASGFTVVGAYSPYPSANILIVTNDELKKNAAETEYGGFGAAQRVALTKVQGDIQVSYTNPVYMANVYRMKGDLKGVAVKLEKALGKVEDFGAKGMTVAKARKYHYMLGMEYFNEPSVLAEFPSHDEAIKAVETGLAAGKEGATKVYRVDIPGKQEAVFGVAMAGKPGSANTPKETVSKIDDQYGTIVTLSPEADQYIMRIIDFGTLKATAHLPYEILVLENKVYAQYARFRIAISFPDLKMMGNNSFMNIMESPEAIKKSLQKTVDPMQAHLATSNKNNVKDVVY